MFVVPSLEVGGTERQVALLARAFADDGGAVVASLRDGPLARPIREAGGAVTLVGPGGILDPRVGLRLLCLMKRTRPRVVHAFLGGFDAVAAIAARLSGVPLVLGSRRELTWWMRPRHRLTQTVGTALSDLVICCADAVRDEAVAREPWPRERYHVVANAVDVAAFATRDRASERSRLGLGDRDFVVVTVASLVAEKSHEDLARAARRLGSLSGLKLLWAGGGPLRSDLERDTSDLRHRGVLRFLGRVDDVAGLLAAADLFVLPSRSEGLPNVVLEAMASGLPVVATAVGGVPEVIRHGVDGWLVPPGSAEALGHAMERLAADPLLRRRMGLAARVRVATGFSWAGCVAAHRELYAGGAA